MIRSKAKVMGLAGKVMHYAWGGYFYLPGLLHLAFKNREPCAEFWLGAHASASASISSPEAGSLSLAEYIAAFPDATLGTEAREEFGRLPYLLKILDVRDMLSIQVHPTKQDAVQAFAAENARGIPTGSPTRNYKDDNHKPELMVALGDFWLLHGFKPAARLATQLEAVPELRFLIPLFQENNYRALYAAVMEMPQAEVNRILGPLLARIVPRYDNDKSSRSSEDFWAARAAKIYNQGEDIDRGIFSIYFFNLVHVRAGQAVFQNAGLPHAYLEGQNVEIMANSDNVLRGGLTPKHVDVPELMKHIRFEATEPKLLEAESGTDGVAVFRTPARDFELSVVRLAKGSSLSLTSRAVQIFLLLEGAAEVVESGQPALRRKKGEAWAAFDGARFEVTARENLVLYRAGIPL